MKRLIINADDFGLTPGVTRGILDAHLNGVVTSTSAMMNSAHIAESLAAANRDAPYLGIGVHLVLTWGKPLLPPEEVSTLVDDTGHFYKIFQLSGRVGNFDLNEVKIEWQTQIEAFISYGRRPDHLDSHHHISYSSPALFAVMLDLANEYNLPIRFPCKSEDSSFEIEPLIQILNQYPISVPQLCITAFYDEGVSIANLSSIISALPEGVSELMCHPGYADSELIEGSTYTTAHEMELRILTSKEIKTCIKENGVSLARFSDL